MIINTVDGKLKGTISAKSWKVELDCVWLYDDTDCKGNMILMIPLSNISSIDVRGDYT